MWLGLEKLGLSKLNIKKSSDIYEKLNFLENIYSIINQGKNIQENLYFYEKVSLTHPPLSVGVIENLNLSENINQNINCRLNIFEDFSFLENLNSDVIIAKNTYENLDFLENINQNIINSVDIYEELTLNELLNQISKISLNIYEASNFIEYINSSVTGYNLELNEAIFNGAIPSGNVLTINSDSYTAFLNLQNVIDKYSGEWIFISPETTEINIQPINNNMEIWIEYQELFL